MSEDPTQMEPALCGPPWCIQRADGLRPSVQLAERTVCPATFDDEAGEINVPPTLVSFAVDVSSSKHIITPEFKKAGSRIVVFKARKRQL